MMDDLPQLALSIRQPWAWCILNLGKDIENRQWWGAKRGPICIHAAKGMTRDEWEDGLSTVHMVSTIRPFPPGGEFPAASDPAFVRGAIVGTAEIVACVEHHNSPWFAGKYGFVLSNVQSVEPISVRGQLGFFEWRKNILAPEAIEAPRQGSML